MNHGQQIIQRTRQVIVDDNIIEFSDMTHFLACRGQSSGDGLRAVGGSVAQTAFQNSHRRRQNEYADGFGKECSDLPRTLPIDFQQDILTGFHGGGDAATRGAVKIAMDFGPLDEIPVGDLFLKRDRIGEMIFDAVSFADTRLACGMRDGDPDSWIVFKKQPNQGPRSRRANTEVS